MTAEQKAEVLRAYRIREEHSVKRVAEKLKVKEGTIRKAVSRYKAWLKQHTIGLNDPAIG